MPCLNRRSAALGPREFLDDDVDWLSMRDEQVGGSDDIVDVGMRNSDRRIDEIADQGDNVGVVWMESRLVDFGAVDFDFRVRLSFEAFDDDKVDRSEHAEQFGEVRLPVAAKFTHQRHSIAEATRTSRAPAARCLKESLPGWSTSKS